MFEQIRNKISKLCRRVLLVLTQYYFYINIYNIIISYFFDSKQDVDSINLKSNILKENQSFAKKNSITIERACYANLIKSKLINLNKIDLWIIY